MALLALEGEMALVAFGLLGRKEGILLEMEILEEEEKALLLFGALLVLWCSWHPFSSVDWTGGHWHFCF